MHKRTIKHCKLCLNPDTRPKVKFDENGICLACILARANRANGAEPINWEERQQELREVVAWGRANSKCAYDCIIGVSGGKDSTRQAFYVRDVLGMRPLLVSSLYPPEQLVERGAYNLSNLVNHGFDCISVGLDPQTWRKTMRKAFREFSNWCKATELPLYAIPVHIAIGYQIPLIFLGENPAFYLGTPIGEDYGGDATRMKYNNTLNGGSPEFLLVDDVRMQDLYLYGYPSDEDIHYARLRIAYLGHYIEDFNNIENKKFAVARGLQLREDPPEDIGDYTQAQSLDEDFYGLNQMLKYLKFGFGQVTDKVGEEIRLGYMDHETGIELIRKYDGKCHPRFIRRFCEYLQITEEEFWEVAERCRNQELWDRDADGNWQLRDPLINPDHDYEPKPREVLAR